MIYLRPVSGLANRMRALDSAVSLSQKIDRQLQVYWLKDAGLNCAFVDLFEPIPDIRIFDLDQFPTTFENGFVKSLFVPELKEALSSYRYLSKHDVKALEIEGFDFEQLKDGDTAIASFSRFYPTAKPYSIFTPIPGLLERIKAESSCFDKNTIGVHIRRTDNTKAIAHSPLELFEKAIDEEIARNSAANFYLSSDCVRTKKLLKSKYKDRLITNFMTAQRGTKEGMQQAVVELYTLSRTQKIFGSYWSSFSHTAAHIGAIEEITIMI